MASYSDNFDRANGEIGANWIEDNGDIDIVSNVAEPQTSGAWNRARYNSVLDSNDHFTQATLGGRDSDAQGCVTVRQASSTFTCYFGSYTTENGVYELKKVVDDEETELDTAPSGTGAVVFKLTVDGATQSLEVATVEVCTDTDSDVTTGLYAGMCAFHFDGRMDNWSAEDLGAGPIEYQRAVAGALAPSGVLKRIFSGARQLEGAI